MKTPDVSTWTYEDKDEQIECLYMFMNHLMELEDERRKEDGPENYHYAMEYLNDVDLSDPADKDLKDIFKKLNGHEREFIDFAMDNGTIGLRIASGHRIYTGEITSWNDDSYSVGFLGYYGSVNGKEVEDVGLALCDGLTREEILTALRKSNFSSIEQWNDADTAPEYLHGDADDYTRIILCANETDDELEKIVDSWLQALKRGKANRPGRTVIVDGKRVVVEHKVIKKNPLVVKAIKQYLKNPERNPEYASNYMIGVFEGSELVGEMTLFRFRETMKAPLSVSIDSLIERFNRCMKEKVKLLKRKSK